MIDGKTFFDQPIKNNLITYDNIIKIATSQVDDYTTGCLSDYRYFKENYELTAIDLSKQQALDTDPRSIQEFNFTGNFNWAEGAFMFFILEGTKETILDFLQGTVRVF